MNDNIGAKLVISQANDANGQITAASISYNGHNYPATGHYTSRTALAQPR
ncbi:MULTISPECIES: hypothetical protein [Bradyrhizobium]|nr:MULTISPECIES: hypothetical protein [Bradyrhizobium]MCP1925757.1 hypothetical protein [Bradyrhizobium elkanii]MCS3476751.1 hypothetical protein [Bradyrhizobium elkanii]MCS3583489.1 hypothetical protein [Bradyrhizobium elkanii]MCS3717058.1 hypothetical protein [Bradyrhizobium elkanii]MCS4010775.1 hypothetical protein [Bradyrhizobium elkanii USDA 61]